MFLTFGSYPLRLTTGILDRSFVVYFQRRHVSYSSHVRSEIRWVLRVNGEGCGRNWQMKKKIRNKTETMVMRTCSFWMIPSQVWNPGSSCVLNLNLLHSPTSFLGVISVTARWRKKGEPKLTHYWIIYVFILNFIFHFVGRSVRFDAEFDVSLNFVKFYWNILTDTM